MEKQNISVEVQNSVRSGLSYKFQRLRERLRHAIENGELSGKLPGERTLAKKFNVNAKTLSKALTDLAAEGVLARSIGRGTYVKGHAPVTTATKRWLVVCDAEQVGWEVVQLIREAHPDLDVITDVSIVRPSFLNQFSAVIDLAANTPDSFVRDLVVRNIPVAVVGKEPRTYSTHSVLFDGHLAVAQLGRDLILGGHRKLAAVEPRQCTVVADTLRKSIARYSAGATVDACFPQDAATMVENGITAFVCQSDELARQVQEQLDRHNLAVPGRVSLVAIGSTSGDPTCSGYFLKRSEKADAIVQLLGNAQGHHPTTLWLAGRYFDRGTMTPLSEMSGEMEMTFNAVTA
jgi:DNA-binding transcriptional regulator YhcF (GntR family)